MDEILQEIRLIASHDEWEYLNSLAKTEPGAAVMQAAIMHSGWIAIPHRKRNSTN
ncbi:MAG: hypothetical protein R3C26_00945 [Calditrichia bacterium]